MRFKDGVFLVITLTMAAALPAQPATQVVRAEAPPPQGSRGPVRISGGVMAGQLISRVNPEYPAEARANGVEGAVVLHVTVGTDGSVESAVPLTGAEVLRDAAVDAVKQWTYKPFLLNGEPVEVDTTVTVNFNLNASVPPQS